MTVSFDNIRKGDTVRIEFAAPLKGWVEGEVVDNDGGFRLLMESSGSFSVYYDEIDSITVIEPPIQVGDAVQWGGRVWLMSNTPQRLMTFDSDGAPEVLHSIPSDAVWLVRGGKLTDRVKVSE